MLLDGEASPTAETALNNLMLALTTPGIHRSGMQRCAGKC